VVHSIRTASALQVRIDDAFNGFAKFPNCLSTAPLPRVKRHPGTLTKSFGIDLSRRHQQMHMMVALIAFFRGRVNGNQDRNLIAVDHELPQIQG